MNLPRPGRPDRVNFALAAGLGAASVLDLETKAFQGNYPGNPWAHLVFLIAISIPVAWRRRSPLAAMIAFGVLQTVYLYVLFPADVQPPLVPFVQLVLVVFNAAAYADGHAARAAWVVLVIGFASDLPALLEGKPLSQVSGPLFALAVVFGLGIAFARIRRQAESNALALARTELEQRDVAERAASEERSRIARELHDVISHDVSMIVLQASVERRVRNSSDETDRALATIEETGREALSELRRMLGVLRKSDDLDPLRPQPGLQHLKDLVEQARGAGVDAHLVVEGERDVIPPGVGIATYRIIQESLTNAAKHACGATVTATVRLAVDALEVEVVDDGAGAAAAVPLSPGGGHGLVGMRERVAVFGGTLDAGHRSGGGFRVHAYLPLPA